MLIRTKNKKGDSETLTPVVISVVIMVLFFGSVFFGCSKISKGIDLYEKTYASQIALFIDRAEPYSEITIDFKRGFEIARENNKDVNEIVKVSDNKIIVSLSNKRGCSIDFPYNYKIGIKPFEKDNKLKITVSK